MHLTTRKETLSDNSEVYEIELQQGASIITFDFVPVGVDQDFLSLLTFAGELKLLIEKYSNESVKVDID